MDNIDQKFKLLHYVYRYFIELPFHRQHIKLLEREIIGSCQSLLDIGCGSGNHMRRITPYLTYSLGVDIFQQSLDMADSKGVYSETKLLSATNIHLAFKMDSFDCVVAFDLIEHLEKPEGLRLLDAMERIASKKVIVFTPNGFLPQGALDGNEQQIHRSGWSVSEMRSLNYRVLGVHGIKSILGERSLPRWKPHKFWLCISVFTQPFCVMVPELSFQIFCVKDMSVSSKDKCK